MAESDIQGDEIFGGVDKWWQWQQMCSMVVVVEYT